MTNRDPESAADGEATTTYPTRIEPSQVKLNLAKLDSWRDEARKRPPQSPIGEEEEPANVTELHCRTLPTSALAPVRLSLASSSLTTYNIQGPKHNVTAKTVLNDRTRHHQTDLQIVTRTDQVANLKAPCTNLGHVEF
ncbi:hypothetical protein CBL_03358 [Carabus blaptoides fortunei]